MRSDLLDKVAELDRPLTIQEERIMGELLAPSRREDLEDYWLQWREQVSEDDQIESALAMLASFLSGWQTRPQELRHQLDTMAAEVVKDLGVVDARGLANWLFARRGSEAARFRGNSKDYYASENSNLLWVLKSGLGNPISLCSLFRLVGRRVGLHVEGCNFPGHFLARVIDEDKLWLIDCFNRGRFMLADDVARHHPAANPAMEELVRKPAVVSSVLMRFLRNLDDAFDKRGQMPERQMMRRLAVKMMDDS
jgi:regulator of sirC expression with transglutaminase-like and TPR domain